MKIRFPILVLLLLNLHSINAQQINRAEYFWDKDPGIGKAYPINFSGPVDTLIQNLNIKIDTLKTGIHFLNVRIRASNNKWTTYHTERITIIDSNNKSKINTYEFFLDNDLGPGKNNMSSFSKTDTFISQFSTNKTKNLSMGWHNIGLRVKGENGKWGSYYLAHFYVKDSSNPTPKIDKVEYFFNTEKGVGKSINLGIFPADTLNFASKLASDTLKPGIHRIYSRARCGYFWSPYLYATFVVKDSSNPNKPVSKLEYIIDKDTFPGKGKPLIFSASDTLKNNFSISAATLSTGWHKITLRTSSKNNHFSTQNWLHFYVEDSTKSNRKITEIEHIANNYTLGTEKGKNTYSPGLDSIALYQVSINSGFPLGRHFEYARLKSFKNKPSTWHRDTFFIINCPMLDTAVFNSPSKLCINDSALLEQKITNLGVWPKDSFNFNWDIDNNGSVESSLSNYKHKFTSSGSIPIKFSFSKKSDSRCRGEIVKTIIVGKTTNDTALKNICDGDSVFFNGKYRKSNGIYKDTFSSISGCDSFIHLKLTVKPNYNISTTKSICKGDSILFNNIYRKTSGTYTAIYSSSFNCDSTVKLVLIVNPVYFKSDTVTICANDSLKRHGKTRKAAGLYKDTLKTILGCDSVFHTLLIVNPNYNATINKSICNGDSILFNGTYRKLSGTYTANLKTNKNCDSVLNLLLKVNPKYSFTSNLQLCEGDSVKFGGQFRKVTGNYSITLSSINGCDSVRILNLTVNTKYTKSDTFTICSGDSLFIHGRKYKNAGLYKDSFKTIQNCDSVFLTYLNVNPVKKVNIFKGICAGDSFVFGSKKLGISGVYTGQFKSSKGCDSIVTLTLQISNEINHVQLVKICEGDSLFAQKFYQKTTGLYFDTFTSTKGCDSIITTNLMVIKPIVVNLNKTLCFGESMVFGSNLLSNSGTYQLKKLASTGCDSIVNLTLTVLNKKESQEEISICQGDSVFIAGAMRKLPGVYVEKLNTTSSCDSFINTKLIVLPKKITNVERQICNGGQVTVGGNTYKNKGTYQIKLKSHEGCDSIVVLKLKVSNQLLTESSITLCAGDSALINGKFIKTSGFYSDTFSAAGGCDSVVNTIVNILPSIFIHTEDTFCAGEKVQIGSFLADSTGTYTNKYLSEKGCDSTIIYHFVFKPKINVQVVSKSIDTLTTNLPFVTYQWFRNNLLIPGATNRELKVTKSGIYDVTVTNSEGCTASTLDDNFLSLQQEKSTAQVTVFPNPSAGTFHIHIEKSGSELATYEVFDSYGKRILSENSIQKTVTINLANLASGIYYLTLNIDGNSYKTKLLLMK